MRFATIQLRQNKERLLLKSAWDGSLGLYAHVTPHMQQTAVMAMDLILDSTAN
jgi:hypothetical protein